MHEFAALLSAYSAHWIHTLEVLAAYLILFSLIAAVLSPSDYTRDHNLNCRIGRVLCLAIACMVAACIFCSPSSINWLIP